MASARAAPVGRVVPVFARDEGSAELPSAQPEPVRCRPVHRLAKPCASAGSAMSSLPVREGCLDVLARLGPDGSPPPSRSEGEDQQGGAGVG